MLGSHYFTRVTGLNFTIQELFGRANTLATLATQIMLFVEVTHATSTFSNGGLDLLVSYTLADTNIHGLSPVNANCS
jgi:hypothetical protein